MKPTASSTTTIPFSQRHRWRWWAMLVMGTVFAAYGLALLTSPAWDVRGIFGEDGFWLWLRGEAYLVFGFLQATIGIGYLRMTAAPADAIVVDNKGITVRRLFNQRHLNWNEVKTIRKGRTSLLVAGTPISLWKLFVCDPRLIRLDTTVVDASMDDLTKMILKHRGQNQPV